MVYLDRRPFHGRYAVAEAFAAHAPDDALVLNGIDAGENWVRAHCRWCAHPDASGGRARRGRIAELTIRVEGELHP